METAALWSACNTTEISSKTNCTTNTANTIAMHSINSVASIKSQFSIFGQFKLIINGIQRINTSNIIADIEIYAVLTNCFPLASSPSEMACVNLYLKPVPKPKSN